MPSSNDFAGGHERQADSHRGESEHEHGRQPDHEIHQGQSFFRSDAENGAIETSPAVPCTTGPAELDKLKVRADPWKRSSRREFRKRSISIRAVRHKGDIRARAIRSSASMAGHAAAYRFSPR